MVTMLGQLRKLSVIRSRIDIITHILNTAEKGARKTRILYQCNLSFRQLNAYLELLTDMGLLRTVTLQTGNNGGSLLFETTNKGKDFIKAYHKLRALLAPYEVKVEREKSDKLHNPICA